MSITSGICDRFKNGLMKGEYGNLHAVDRVKVALLTTSANQDPTVDNYGELDSDEVASGNNYTRDSSANMLEPDLTASGMGASAAKANHTGGNTVAVLDFKQKDFSSVTLTTRGALLYLSSAGADTEKLAIALVDFGTSVTASSGNLSLIFPNATQQSGFIRLG